LRVASALLSIEGHLSGKGEGNVACTIEVNGSADGVDVNFVCCVTAKAQFGQNRSRGNVAVCFGALGKSMILII
jgi:hypothetical protein